MVKPVQSCCREPLNTATPNNCTASSSHPSGGVATRAAMLHTVPGCDAQRTPVGDRDSLRFNSRYVDSEAAPLSCALERKTR